MAGDFHAKSPRWGGNVADSRGNEVVQFLLSNNLDVINDATSPPTFETEYAQAWIDLTIFSLVWRRFATTWRLRRANTIGPSLHSVFTSLLGAPNVQTIDASGRV